MSANFGQLLSRTRSEAGLSHAELGGLCKLPPLKIEEMEHGGELPGFDVCYRLSQALSARCQRRFILQDLWAAVKMDRNGGSIDSSPARQTREEPA